MMPTFPIFMIIPRNVPVNIPNADFTGYLFSLLNIISPNRAPKKAPIIEPKGGKNIKPISIPRILPQMPPFPVPDLFAEMKGNTESMIYTKAVSKNKIIKVEGGYISQAPAREIRIRPEYAIGGPGIPGSMLKIRANIKRSRHKKDISIARSICLCHYMPWRQ